MSLLEKGLQICGPSNFEDDPIVQDLNPGHLDKLCVGPSISFITTDLIDFNFASNSSTENFSISWKRFKLAQKR